MTNSIKISPQRTSFILSVSVILYWATDSYLYLSCHINLMEYSTPVILYITAMILVCGVLQRFFFRFITKNELSLSFGKQVRPLPEQIKEIDPECPKDKDINCLLYTSASRLSFSMICIISCSSSAPVSSATTATTSNMIAHIFSIDVYKRQEYSRVFGFQIP